MKRPSQTSAVSASKMSVPPQGQKTIKTARFSIKNNNLQQQSNPRPVIKSQRSLKKLTMPVNLEHNHATIDLASENPSLSFRIHQNTTIVPNVSKNLNIKKAN